MLVKKVTLKITGPSSDSLFMELEIRYAENNTLVCDLLLCPLPALPLELLNTYQEWRSNYLAWGRGWGNWLAIVPPSQPIETNFSSQDIHILQKSLVREFNNWLASSIELASIRESILAYVPPQEYCERADLLSLVVQTSTNDRQLNLYLQKLPWQEWQFIRDRYRLGVSVSTNIAPVVHQTTGKFRALAICGHYSNPELSVNLQPDLQALQENLGSIVDLEIWVADPQRNNKFQLLQKLNDETYHLVFFSGHSSADRQIKLNDSEFISTDDGQFIKILKRLKDRGLILAFFNSCDGLAIAGDLMSVGIPYIVVMKELVHDSLAQEFIKKFLANACQPHVPIHGAVNKAREELWLEGLPYGDFLPVLFQNPEQPPFYLIPTTSSPQEIDTDRRLASDKHRSLGRSGHPFKNRLISYLLLFSLVLLLVLGYNQLAIDRLSICEFAARLPSISCGEEILFRRNDGKQSHKESGFKKIAESISKPQYEAAIFELNQDWNANKDPETAIAIENAKLEGNPKSTVKTIAVVVPAKSSTPSFVADGILKGVAYAQQSHNKNSAGWKLRILVADDGNDPQQGEEVAKALVNREDVMAVIGHFSSQVTLPIIPIYAGKTVLISATATSHELQNKSFFFRTVPASNITAKQMVNNWVTPTTKAIIFYDRNGKFSVSLTQEFENEAKKRFPDFLVKKIDLGEDNNIADEIQQGIRQGANSIVLFPDAYTGDVKTNKKSAAVIELNNGRLRILGNTSIYDLYKYYNSGNKTPQLYGKLVVSVPWDAKSDKNFGEQFKLVDNPQQPREIPTWWSSEIHKDIEHRKDVEHRVVLAYDATQVLLTALDQANNRSDVRKIISTPYFDVEGISGNLTFKGSDRQPASSYLISPNCNGDECKGFKPYRPQSNP